MDIKQAKQHRVDRPSHLSAQEKRNRKQSLITHGSPAGAKSIADAVVIKDEDIFFLTCPDGSVPLDGHHGFGLYYHDCRFLNGYEIRLNGARPDELVANAGRGFMAVLELTNPDFHGRRGQQIHKQELGIKSECVVEARTHLLHDRITVQNFSLEECSFRSRSRSKPLLKMCSPCADFLPAKPDLQSRRAGTATSSRSATTAVTGVAAR